MEELIMAAIIFILSIVLFVVYLNQRNELNKSVKRRERIERIMKGEHHETGRLGKGKRRVPQRMEHRAKRTEHHDRGV